MVLELSKSFTHSCGKMPAKAYSDEQLKDMLLDWMTKQGIDTSKVSFSSDGTLQIEGTPNLKLHSLLLKAEELGLKMKYTKKTLIEIC
ncbi:MAG: hypothetical protein GYB31_04280 [Bacteroidetes bacterium]|nr:hypothetical protein [Bacteroidota bacterium]